MKENNSWIVWLIALVAVVALVVAIVALGKISATGEAINRNKPNIKANSCNADDICEANSIEADDSVFKHIYGKMDGGLTLLSRKIVPSGGVFSKILLTDSLVILEQNLYVNNELTIQGLTKINSLSINSSTMIPNNPVAYVCVDANGYLFRKITKCN